MKVGRRLLAPRHADPRARAHISSRRFRRAKAALHLSGPNASSFLEQNREAYDGVLQALKALETEIAALPYKPEELINIARRSFELRGETEFLMESTEHNYVYWMERRNKGVFLTATPIDVSRFCASSSSSVSRPWCSLRPRSPLAGASIF